MRFLWACRPNEILAGQKDANDVVVVKSHIGIDHKQVCVIRTQKVAEYLGARESEISAAGELGPIDLGAAFDQNARRIVKTAHVFPDVRMISAGCGELY